MDRRTLLAGAGIGIAGGALAKTVVDLSPVNLHLPGGPSLRETSVFFPQKGEMIVQRERPPLLETPFEVFDQGTLTPNDRHFVRWSGGAMPTLVDPAKHRLTVRGAVKTLLSLSLAELLRAGEHVEIVAVNQCAGNSRGFSQPRVAGTQWGHGAMSNARWRGVRLRDLLDKAGVGGDAKRVRFAGLDVPAMPGAPQKIKSIPIDIARRDEVLIAFAMNGEALPLLNGFPLRLVVPGWFATYWIKMLTDIEVLTVDEDDSYFMAKSYRMPAPGVSVKPGDKDFPTVPITTMGPRSFVTSHADGASVPRVGSFEIRGIAFGGNTGVEKVKVAFYNIGAPQPTALVDTWLSASDAELGPEDGTYGFRAWRATARTSGFDLGIVCRCYTKDENAQPDPGAEPIPWNPSGYARNVVEHVHLRAV